jgi:forkhead box protein K
MPSHSPPPASLPRAVPDISPLAVAQLPTARAIHKSNSASASKKRKKSNPAPLLVPKPEDMPPRPLLTYAQLCYRAIKAIGGKATLQEINQWIIASYDWYKYNDAGWQV